MKITINHNAGESITICSDRFSENELIFLGVSIYVSNRGIILRALGGGGENDSSDGTAVEYWENRILSIGDTLIFHFMSTQSETEPMNFIPLQSLPKIGLQKAEFHLTLPNGRLFVCHNADYDAVQFEMRWDNLSNSCRIYVGNYTVNEDGSSDSSMSLRESFCSEQSFKLEIKPLINQGVECLRTLA